MGVAKHVAQHKNEAERLEAAKLLVETVDLKSKVVIDILSNETAKLYGVIADRLYIIQNGKIFYQGGPGPRQYNVDELKTKLSSMF